MEEYGLDRRSFLKGAAIAGATVAGLGLVGCASGDVGKEEGEATGTAAAKDVVETLETDIVIVGAGISGLACMVQAGLDGSNVIVLEKGDATGGNGSGVEGMFAVGTELAASLGIDVKPGDVIKQEMVRAQYRSDGALWHEFVMQSNDNYEWCLAQGCEYEGVVDTYGPGLLPTFHWWKTRHAAAGYVEPMTKKAEDLGIDIRFNTSAYELIMTDGKVAGVYAKNSDGADIRIDCKAVILATGGFGSNEELIQRQGWDTTDIYLCGKPGHDGDGYMMAMAAGAKDMLPQSTTLIMNYIPALPRETYVHPYNGVYGIAGGAAPIVWVNERGERFCDENIIHENMMLQSQPFQTQQLAYTVFDAAIWKAFTTAVGAENADAELADALAKNQPESLWAADNFSDLATAAGIDPATFVVTMEQYNADASAGVDDTQFGKPAGAMVPLSTPPYYIGLTRANYLVGIGGIFTNRDYEVVAEAPGYSAKDPVPGLYAIGMDGEMRYRNIYTINMPGTACAGCIRGGRNAAMNAASYIAG